MRRVIWLPAWTAALVGLLSAALGGCAPTLAEVTPSTLPDLPRVSLQSVTVLPLDLVMEAEEPIGVISEPASTRAALRALPPLGEGVRAALRARGFHAAELAWDGTVATGLGRRAEIDPTGLANLSDWLLNFGYGRMANQTSAEGSSIAPLPFSSDATLFVGGYGHLHQDRPHRDEVAADVAVGIGIAAAVIGTIALVALASKGHGGSPHLPSSSSGAAGVALRALTFPVELGARVALATTRMAVDVAPLLPPGHVHGPACNVYLGIHGGVEYAPGVRERPTLKEEAKKANELALSATLVENRTGRILWSAAQAMEIDPVDEQELRQAVDHLLEKLPHAR